MSFWAGNPGGAIVTDLTPYASVGATASLLYARLYSGYFGFGITVLFGTPVSSLGPRGINDASSTPDFSSIGWTGYIYAPTGGTFSASPSAVDDAIAMWVGRISVKTPTLSNHFAGTSYSGGGLHPGRAGSVELRPGYTPVRTAYGQIDGAGYGSWSITLPPGASFVHATAGLGF